MGEIVRVAAVQGECLDAYFDICVLNFIHIYPFCFISAYSVANDLYFSTK